MNEDTKQKIITLLDAAAAQATQLEDELGSIELFDGSVQAVAANIKGMLDDKNLTVYDQIEILAMLDKQMYLLMQEIHNMRDEFDANGRINVKPVAMVMLVFTVTAAVRHLILLQI